MSIHKPKNDQIDEVNVLELTLHNNLIGYLVGSRNGRNVLSFTNEFRHNSARPIFSLIYIMQPSF